MTNAAGTFVLILPGDVTGDGITLELTPAAAPRIRGSPTTGLSLPQQNTDLGTITLPAYLTPTPFQVTVHGEDADGRRYRAPRVRALHHARGRRRPRIDQVRPEWRHSDGGGTTNMSLMPGDTDNPRPYTLSVVPPAGLDLGDPMSRMTSWPSGPAGAPVTLLRDVTLQRRAVMTGNVVSANGVPVAKRHGHRHRRRALRCRIAWPARPPPARPPTRQGRSRCRSIRAPTSSNTIRRRIAVPAADRARCRGRPRPTSIRAGPPARARARGGRRAQDAGEDAPAQRDRPDLRAALPDDGCRAPPLLRAETQTDASGHFRAIVAEPGDAIKVPGPSGL